jgi:hypothetical protein
MIRFGGDWMPAHDVWKKMETANVVVDAIDHFNTSFPNLASAETRDVVPLVKQRLKDIELRIPVKYKRPDLGPVAAELLDAMSPEEAIEVLAEKHDAQIDLMQLIQLAGEKCYVKAMYREAAEYALNLISADQTAQLWNDLARPAPGGGLWTGKKITALLDAGG